MRRLAWFAITLVACGYSGGLEQAKLAGECEGTTGCIDELAAGPLAAGGTVAINVRIDSAGSGTAVLDLLAADENVLEITGHQITGLSTGMSAVLVMESKTGAVVDFFHLFVAEPDRLELARLGGVGAGAARAGASELREGDQLTLGVVAFRGPQRLVGSGHIDWTLTGDAVTVLDDGNPDRRRIVARRAGDATLTVESMGLSQALDITVLP
jgi:hypothetical protein